MTDLLTLQRLANDGTATLGSLRVCGNHICHVIEDAPRPEKIHGKTRIPAGRYKLGFRMTGGFHQKYSDKFPDIHKGMIELLDVPNFKYILVHIGNFHTDTDGCLVVGDRPTRDVNNNYAVTASRTTYLKTYPVLQSLIAARVLKHILILDEEKGAENEPG